LDKGEFLALFEKRFEGADQDHDSTLDKKNLTPWRADRFRGYSRFRKDR